jgi:hypothetical protein
MEREKEEAFRIYVSDSLALYTTMITRGEIDIPRYADIYKAVPQQPQETSEEIKSRFDKLRRK